MADRIEINPAVMLGKPVIRGTRIPVELIVRKYSEGATEGELLQAVRVGLKQGLSAGLASEREAAAFACTPS